MVSVALAYFWIVSMLVVVGVFGWVVGGQFVDRSNERHMERHGWCPTCGRDVSKADL